ncbi:hypothetical protein EON66_05945 [archaeon]|nr:MAG: hypothetical protein EON66_05945 [archaeon]
MVAACPCERVRHVQIAEAQAVFDEFYMQQYSKGRKLQWQHQLGHCILKATFGEVRIPPARAPRCSWHPG